MTDATPLIDIAGLTVGAAGPAPLRMGPLTIARDDRIVLAGLNAAGAEAFMHLVTGALLPDEGSVRISGRDTREIATDTEWLASLDRFGIVTDRAVLLDELSLAANLALPLTVAVDPLTADTRARVAELAEEVELRAGRLEAPARDLTPVERARLRLARALAPRPSLLLLERPTAGFTGRDESRALGALVRRVADARGIGWVATTDDATFASASGGRRLSLDSATGRWRPDGGWRRLWRRS